MRSSLAGVLALALLLVPGTAQGATGTAGPDVFNGADSQRNVYHAGGSRSSERRGARRPALRRGGRRPDRRRLGRGQALWRLLPRGGPGRDRYSRGAGNDQVCAANGRSERVDCGSGPRDIARVDGNDRVSGCEIVLRG